jgi:hypothetical protein
MVLNNNNITAINNTQTTALSSTDGITEEIDTNAHLDFDNLYEIRNCLNITTQDINTNTITANAPNTDVKLGTNTDLDLNGNNILNVGKIDGIENSGGVYSESSGFSTASTTEINILAQGANEGSLSIPANTFKALNMYSFKASGVLTGGSNDIFTLRAKTTSPAPALPVILGEIIVQLQDNNLNNVAWDITIDFTIRTIGVSGVASLVLSGAFRYTNNNDVVRTFLRTIVLTSGFDTTIDNTLELTFQNDITDPLTSFRIDQASFTKWY